MNYFSLIKDSYKFLADDFIGFSINYSGFFYKVIHFLEVILLFFIMFVLGGIILRKYFYELTKLDYSVFLSFSLGYILISTLIFLLGFTGFLSSSGVLFLILILMLVALFDLKKYPQKIIINRKFFNFDPIKYLIIGFVLIVFLRLIPPQSAGDPLDYHLRFPRIYLYENTMMIPALGDESYTNVPHLPEMLYVISQVFTKGEASRIIHFGFYILICIFLYRFTLFDKRFKKAPAITAMLFASAPFILELGYQAFSDFPAVLCIILSIILLVKDNITKKSLILSGLLIGGALASKLWVLYYLPFLTLFVLLTIKGQFFEKVRKSFLYLIPALSVVSLWYLRGFLLIGNPFYVNTDQGRIDQNYPLIEIFFHYLTPGGIINRTGLPTDYGPLYLIGLIVFIFLIISKKLKLQKKLWILIIILLTSIYVVPVPIGNNRYSFPYMIIVLMASGVGFSILYKKVYLKFLILLCFFMLLIYYLINTLSVLPYGFGWADKNAYLKRELIKDHASYYDYNGEFSKKISKDEEIITYGVFELYYAHFRYKNLYYFVDQLKNTFNMPERFNKLLIRGGDFAWMCEKVKLINCSQYEVELITHDSQAKQYLYKIKYRK